MQYYINLFIEASFKFISLIIMNPHKDGVKKGYSKEKE